MFFYVWYRLDTGGDNQYFRIDMNGKVFQLVEEFNNNTVNIRYDPVNATGVIVRHNYIVTICMDNEKFKPYQPFIISPGSSMQLGPWNPDDFLPGMNTFTYPISKLMRTMVAKFPHLGRYINSYGNE